MTLAETGTRGLLGAVIGAAGDEDEPAWPGGCCTCWARACCMLADRAYDSAAFLAGAAATGAALLVRGKASRSPPSCRSWRTGLTCHRSAAWTCGSSTRTWP